MNQTTVKEFFIVGLPGVQPEYYELTGAVFFLIYVITVAGNSFLVALFFIEQQLQKPMYIIMLTLAFSDIGFCTVALPKAIARYWLDDGAIPFQICLFQAFLVHYFGALNSLIMMTMSLDRYLAICFPLRYPVLMTNRTMGALTTFCSVAAVFFSGVAVNHASKMSYCGPNKILHCYCDLVSITPLVCGDNRELAQLSFTLAMLALLAPFAFIIFSYISIVVAVMRIADAQGRYKAFSTCATQLCIISISYLPCFVVLVSYTFPSVQVNMDLRISLIIFYSLFPPLVNPLIYCYRTKEIRDLLHKWFCQRNVISQKPTVTAVSE